MEFLTDLNISIAHTSQPYNIIGTMIWSKISSANLLVNSGILFFYIVNTLQFGLVDIFFQSSKTTAIFSENSSKIFKFFTCTDIPLNADTRYNDKLHYNDTLTVTKPSVKR